MQNEVAETWSCVSAWEWFSVMCVWFGPQLKCVISSTCLTNGAKRKKELDADYCFPLLLSTASAFSTRILTANHFQDTRNQKTGGRIDQ